MSTIRTTQPKRKLKLSAITVRVLSGPDLDSIGYTEDSAQTSTGSVGAACSGSNTSTPPPPPPVSNNGSCANPPRPTQPPPQRDGAAW